LILNIIVTGSNGRLGTNLCSFLESRGYSIFRYFRKRNSDDTEYVQSFNLEQILSQKNIDFIINLIALTDLNFCENNILKAYQSNIYSLEKIISVVPSKNTHLIHLSTDQVYSGPGPHTEGKVNPLNVYALTKYLSEIIANNIKSTILRTNYVGKSPISQKQSLTDWLYISFYKKNKIYLYDDIYFSPLFAFDLCKTIEQFIKKPYEGTFNIGSKGSISKAQFALKFASKLGLDSSNAIISNYDETSSNIKRPLDMTLDSTKYENLFNVSLPSIEKTINSVVDDYKNLMQ